MESFAKVLRIAASHHKICLKHASPLFASELCNFIISTWQLHHLYILYPPYFNGSSTSP